MSKGVAREYLEALLIAAIFLKFTNAFVVQTFYIPSGSMERTLLVGDHLFVNRFIYGPEPTAAERWLLPGRDVRRGDIVIFRSPEPPHADLVKRCVAQSGDRVEVAAKQLYLNGRPVEDASYTQHSDHTVYPDLAQVPNPLRRRDNFGPLVVPADSYFCMGDNRDDSKDSRYWGTLPEGLVKGRAVLIYWSYGGEESGGEPHGWWEGLKRLGGMALGFFTSSRWSRTFHLIR